MRQLAIAPQLRVLVLRRSGDKAFIGGADIGEMATLDAPRAEAFITRLAGLCDAVARSGAGGRAPGGWCLGGGLEVALACDIRVSDDTAKFGMPEVRVGIPSVIHATLLPRLIGESRAHWLLLCCENIGRRSGKTGAWCMSAVPSAGSMGWSGSRADALAALPPLALRQQKRLLRHWQTVPPAQAVPTASANSRGPMTAANRRR